MKDTWIWSPGWEDPLEKGTATHSSVLAWRIPQTEEPDGLQAMGLQGVRHDWASNTFLALTSHNLLLSLCNNRATMCTRTGWIQGKWGHGPEHIEEWHCLMPFFQGVLLNIPRKGECRSLIYTAKHQVLKSGSIFSFFYSLILSVFYYKSLLCWLST